LFSVGVPLGSARPVSGRYADSLVASDSLPTPLVIPEFEHTLAIKNGSGASDGAPECVPFSLARSSPALTRREIRNRSSPAIAPRIAMIASLNTPKESR